jgi:hypothetical protein
LGKEELSGKGEGVEKESDEQVPSQRPHWMHWASETFTTRFMGSEEMA